MANTFQMNRIGENPISVITSIDREQAEKIMRERECVFILDGFEWSSVTGKATLRFRPGNGIVEIQDLREGHSSS